MGSIKLEKVEKWFGDVQVIKGVDLDIGDGELVIFGRSVRLRQVHFAANDLRT